MRKRPIASGIQLAIGACVSCLGLVGQQAFSQQAPQSQGGVEEVTVTGSYISRAADRPQPVQVLTNVDINAQQQDTVAQVLRDMPAVSSANVNANSLDPSNAIDLRGLGSRSTLVLIDGQRQTIDANNLSVIDVDNLVPSIMVKRVETVLDGASALYGSDAVAGVVNFLTRDDFEGAEFQMSTQVAEAQSDVPETHMSGIWGSQGDTNSVVMGFELRRRNKVMEAENIRSVDRLATGLKTAFYNPGSFLAGDGSGFHPDPLCGSTLIGGNGANDYTNEAGHVEGPFCRGLLTWRRTLIPQSDQLTGMAIATHKFGMTAMRQIKVSMNLARADMTRHEGTGLPYLGLSSYQPNMPANNPGVIEAHNEDPNFPLTNYIGIFSRLKAPVEGPVLQTTHQWTYRTAVEMDGAFGSGNNWTWHMTGTYSANDQREHDVDVIAARVVRAIEGFGGPDCKYNPVTGPSAAGLTAGQGPCMWYNPFASRLLAKPGDPTYNDPSLIEWMQWGETPTGYAHLYTVEGVTTGNLWNMGGGQTGIAVGVERRRQALSIKPDPIQKDGGFAFAPQVVDDWSSNRDTSAVFAELDMYPAKSFELDLAARYEKTGNASATTPKVSMLWTPTSKVFVRASAGKSFRIASEFQSYGTGEGLGSIATIGGEVSQARGLNVGNPNLKPEKSDNWTFGVTWDMTDKLTLDTSLWSYDFKDLVTASDATAALLADAADGYINDMQAHPLFPGSPNQVCEVTGAWIPVFDAQGRLTNGNTRPSYCVTGLDFVIFRNKYINANRVSTDGIDLALTFDTTLKGGGNFTTRLTTEYVNSYKGTGPNGQLLEAVGTDGYLVDGVTFNPRQRGTLTHTYQKGNNALRATWRYTAGTKFLDPTFAASSQSSYTQLDLTYTHTLPRMNDSQVTFAVLNVADRAPPLAVNGLLTSNSLLYDPRGRMFRAQFYYKF